MAFGDGGNGIPIVCEAGTGVAMGNVNESLKTVANYVTASVDEEGIRKSLEYFAF